MQGIRVSVSVALINKVLKLKCMMTLKLLTNKRHNVNYVQSLIKCTGTWKYHLNIHFWNRMQYGNIEDSAFLIIISFDFRISILLSLSIKHFKNVWLYRDQKKLLFNYCVSQTNRNISVKHKFEVLTDQPLQQR